jgi:hypothetical protein
MQTAWLRPGDYLAIVIALVLVAASYVVYWSGLGQTAQAEIRVAGKHWGHLDLFVDQTVAVHGKIGDSIIEVKGGKARFISSPCSNKLCIAQGWLHHGGETAVCLPNAITLQILSNDPRYDVVNF